METRRDYAQFGLGHGDEVGVYGRGASGVWPWMRHTDAWAPTEASYACTAAACFPSRPEPPADPGPLVAVPHGVDALESGQKAVVLVVPQEHTHPCHSPARRPQQTCSVSNSSRRHLSSTFANSHPVFIAFAPSSTRSRAWHHGRSLRSDTPSTPPSGHRHPAYSVNFCIGKMLHVRG